MDTFLMQEAPSYTAYRERFLDTVKQRGGVLSHYEHPLKGRDGETLYTDVAQFGNPEAKKWLIIISGTHGVEGYYGSMCQNLYLQQLNPNDLENDTALLFIHLINPWGTSWQRRVNEDNVDLNRNFVNFENELPENSVYKRVSSLFGRSALNSEKRAEARTIWDRAEEELGRASLQSQVQAGQHHDPDGIFFAGQHSTWSNVTLHRIFESLPESCTDAICMDLHTGAGEFGHPMLMAISDRHYPGIDDAKELFGPWLYVVYTAMGNTSATGVSASTDGYTSKALVNMMEDKRFMQLVIECGTYTHHLVEHPVMADHYLHLRGDDPQGLSEAGKEAKQQLLEHFFHMIKTGAKPPGYVPSRYSIGRSPA
ncbi:M14 family metallopeptidase [Paenalcaligenes niemegkensis]|uniref:DUF2817 domain-containing protein n=1 Tax=Paenalcaligenes niemegkensis TaxID=2895469 RepID=UPI001EE8344C|nr:DUF2817 domain-containing protein [Paenalcaligenes niemegkensis]MCQ9618292.1 M14 family metallopeptidase [Paenalcaligenes niemegkensis]